MKALVWVKDTLAAKDGIEQYHADLGFLGSASLYAMFDLNDDQEGFRLLLNGKRVCKLLLESNVDNTFKQADQQIADHLGVAAGKLDLKVV